MGDFGERPCRSPPDMSPPKGGPLRIPPCTALSVVIFAVSGYPFHGTVGLGTNKCFCTHLREDFLLVSERIFGGIGMG